MMRRRPQASSDVDSSRVASFIPVQLTLLVACAWLPCNYKEGFSLKRLLYPLKFLPDGSAPLASPQPGTKSQHHVYRDDRCKGVHRTFSAKGLKATIKYSSSDVRELVEDDEEYIRDEWS